MAPWPRLVDQPLLPIWAAGAARLSMLRLAVRFWPSVAPARAAVAVAVVVVVAAGDGGGGGGSGRRLQVGTCT
jgi:hypothetical protein